MLTTMIYAIRKFNEADEDEREWLTEALGEPVPQNCWALHLQGYTSDRTHDPLLLLWECVIVLCRA